MSDSHNHDGHNSGDSDRHSGHGTHETHTSHGTHSGHGYGPSNNSSSTHDQKHHAAHGTDDPKEKGHGAHGDRGVKKPPWGNVIGILVLIVLIFLLLQKDGGAKPAIKTLNVTPGLDNVFNTTLGAILDDPLSYKGLTVSVRGVPGYRDAAEAKAKRFDLYQEGRSIRMNVTGEDLPRVVTYQVVARVRVENVKAPVLDVLSIEPVYDKT